jgi:hypothetical protein
LRHLWLGLKQKLDDMTSFAPVLELPGLRSSSISLSPLETELAHDKTDFIVTMKPGNIPEIFRGAKTCEFRPYPLEATHMWVYESAPVSAVRYYCVIAPPKVPGHLDDEDLGIEDNRLFQTGQDRYGATHAHKILELWKLADEGLTPKELRDEGILKGVPRKYTFLGREAICRLEDGMVKLLP